MKKKMTRQLIMFAITAGLLTGCGSSGKSMMTSDTSAPAAITNGSMPQEYYESADYEYGDGIAYDSFAFDSGAASEEMSIETVQKGDGAVTGNQTQNPDSMTLLEEKLVYHCNLEIETLDYPATVTAIKENISKYGGVIQSESENDSGARWYYEDYRKTSATMHNYLEVRIPSKNYDSFLSELDGVGKVISKSTSVDNISQRYYDTTAQIEALKIQEKNLLAMMEKCETIEDMIAVEQRLSDVQYELSGLQTSRRYMDMDVAYSYVNINITEVMEYRQESEPVRRNTFIDRLKNTLKQTGTGFLAFLEGFLFLIIRLSPYILIIAVICFVVLRNKINSFRENCKIKKEEKRAARELHIRNQIQQNQDKEE